MKARLMAFAHALRGAHTLLATQKNAQIHALATVVVIGLGFYCHVSLTEWAMLAMAVSMVWFAEAMNTAIEFLADEVTLERRVRIKHAKDVAAFGVLAAVIGAAVVGAVIFTPHLISH